ncbi:MAG: NADH-ubiquinone oxidoreductase-F iron-sulfur binding region domain-containing protein [Syntrophobacteraceae bacterium]
MGILKSLTRKLEEKKGPPLSRKLSEWKKCFVEPENHARVAAFCDPQSKKPCVTLCAAGAECSCGCGEVRDAMVGELSRQGVDVTVGTMKVGCGGNCLRGPLMGFPQKQFFYVGVKAADVPRVVEETIIGGKLLFPFLSLNPERSYRSDIFYDKATGLLATIDDQVCMVGVARYFLTFEENLSCGKCVPCRIGMKRALECVERIATGEGSQEDLNQIRSLCKIMEETPNCAFAVTSIRPLTSAVTHFEDEFRAHFEQKLCPAGRCKELVEYQRKLAIRERLGLGVK